MTARFDKLTLIDVADSRANKVSWKAIGQELNLTATELKAIRKDRTYRMVAAEVMVATDADVSVFGVESHMEGVVELHAAEMKAEAEASKVEETVEVETTTDTTEEVAEVETTNEVEETAEMTTAPTTEELSERLEALKARYTEAFGLDLEGNEVIAAVEVETPKVSTSQLKTEKDEAYKAYQTALNAFQTAPDYETTLERKEAKDAAFEVYNQACIAYDTCFGSI